MSYDLYLQNPPCTACGRGAENVHIEYDSPTYNFGSVIRQADKIAGGEGCSFAAIHQRQSTQAIQWFQKILEVLEAHTTELLPLYADNGWGTHDELARCFKEYIELCVSNKNGVWHQLGDGEGLRLCCTGWQCGILDHVLTQPAARQGEDTWTQEQIDAAKAEAKRLVALFADQPARPAAPVADAGKMTDPPVEVKP